ncbi:MAG: SpoIID/LytB domain-containing protein [Cyanophyceae cyanobacterium]
MLLKISQKQFLACSFFLGLLFSPSVRAEEIEIKVGIVQRFGDEETDELTIASPQGDTLTLRGEAVELEANQVELEVEMRPLAIPAVEERLVLSDHATFETAEYSAQQWEALGIEVEVTQPERWQVWAKRDVYETPLLRRWLLQSLQAQGYAEPYLDTQVVLEKPQIILNVDGDRTAVSELEITAAGALIQVKEAPEQKTHLYPGSLKLQPNAYGTFTLVNEVPLESYLRGVVPHEIGPAAPKGAAEAQAIIARTYALRNLRRFQADNYELCASVHCQVYFGLADTHPQADQSIAATRGLVLTYQNELVDALYSSTTGGITAPFSDIWNGSDRPYLKAVIDSPQPVWDLSQRSLADEQAFRDFISLQQGFNETGRNVFRWSKQGDLEQLNEDLQKYLEKTNHPLADFNTIESLEIVERSPSGRILKLIVQTDRGLLELHKTEVRSALGPPRSTLFYIEPIYDEAQVLKGYTFIGGGFGHGVGLSQFGSYNLANLGWSAEQILSFYYPGTTLQSLDESVVFWRAEKPKELN